MKEFDDRIPLLVWEKPSSKALHSVPLGNGEIGVNIWVEKPGDVIFYIAKTDAWSEHGRLLKLGRVRLSFSPAAFDSDYYQESLSPASGTAEVKAGRPGYQICVKTWVDANLPVIRVEVTSDQPVHLQAKVELWRTERRMLLAEELHWGLHEGPEPLVEGPDTLVPPRDGKLVWFHRNESSIWSANLERQGLADLTKTARDPLLHRTLGCAMGGEGLAPTSHDTLNSTVANIVWSLEVHPYVEIGRAHV